MAASDLISTLLLSLILQGLQSLEHLLTNLLRRFHIVIEFLLVDAVLGSEKLSQLGLSLLEVDSLTSSHVLDAVLDNVLLNDLASFGFPVSLVSQVVVATDVVHLFGMFEFLLTARHDVSV